jgi:hypothetical protein
VVLNAYLRDNDRAYLLTADGYSRLRPDGAEPFDAQEYLIEWYRSHPSTGDEGS